MSTENQTPTEGSKGNEGVSPIVMDKHREVFERATENAEWHFRQALDAGKTLVEAREVALQSGCAVLAQSFPDSPPTEKPTDPGWYWLESNDEWTIVHLRMEANGSLKANSLFPVNELKGRWYRILPPIPLRPSRPSVQTLPLS